MKKELLSILVGGLIVLTVVSACFTAGAALGSHRIEKYRSIPLQKIATGTIIGTVTNQNGNPVSFVRVAAFGNKSDGGREFGFAITHLLINGKGTYEMQVEPGRYLFVRAGKLPLYIGAWAGPIYVNDGETVTLDLSIRIGIKNVVFCDTTIEFKETLKYIKDVEKHYNIKIAIIIKFNLNIIGNFKII